MVFDCFTKEPLAAGTSRLGLSLKSTVLPTRSTGSATRLGSGHKSCRPAMTGRSPMAQPRQARPTPTTKSRTSPTSRRRSRAISSMGRPAPTSCEVGPQFRCQCEAAHSRSSQIGAQWQPRSRSIHARPLEEETQQPEGRPIPGGTAELCPGSRNGSLADATSGWLSCAGTHRCCTSASARWNGAGEISIDGIWAMPRSRLDDRNREIDLLRQTRLAAPVGQRRSL